MRLKREISAVTKENTDLTGQLRILLEEQYLLEAKLSSKQRNLVSHPVFSFLVDRLPKVEIEIVKLEWRGFKHHQSDRPYMQNVIWENELKAFLCQICFLSKVFSLEN